MDAKLSMGYRQNNPMNLRPLPSGSWNGQNGNANGFCVFSDPRYCFRAWLISARHYVQWWNCHTIHDFIYHYAPPTDGNDTETYISQVAGYMGINPEFAFDLETRKLAFIKGQMIEEIGGIPYADEVIEAGFAWAK